MGTGWVYQGGYRRGVLPGYYPAVRGEVPEPAKRARKPCKGWSGGFWELGRTRYGAAAGTVMYHPAGPVSPPVGFPVHDLADCRLTANRARIDLFS